MGLSDETQLREADQFIEELRRSIHHGFGDVNTAKELLRTVLRRQMWKDRIVNMTDRRQTYAEFIRFVTEPPPAGLATTTDTLDNLAHGDDELEDLLTHALNRGAGAPAGNKNATKTTFDNIQDCFDAPDAPTGTSRAAALRRLSKDRPDLHEQVVNGAISPHAAMVEAGFRTKTITVRPDPESVARIVINHFTPEQIAELIERLAAFIPLEEA